MQAVQPDKNTERQSASWQSEAFLTPIGGLAGRVAQEGSSIRPSPTSRDNHYQGEAFLSPIGGLRDCFKDHTQAMPQRWQSNEQEGANGWQGLPQVCRRCLELTHSLDLRQMASPWSQTREQDP